ncbi:MAG: prepilin-type N-terminal cleavage/methylation domain-containing protein [Oligoflexia bacterium]|nr:prepilin-type N-terminal cleavage/methylation domain-containing protein [Oligoflexia bacterium]
MKKTRGFQHFFTNNQGFSFVEMMIVAGIMGMMSYFLMTMIENQNKSTKELEGRVESIDIIQSIKGILSSNQNCIETFKNLTKSDFLKKEVNLNDKFISISLVRTDANGNKSISEKFKAGTKLSTNLSINSYQFDSKNLDAAIDEKNNQGEINLLVKFKFGKNRNLSKKIPLFLIFDQFEKVQSCFYNSQSNQHPIVTIDATKDIDYAGSTGTEACNKIAKNCLFVISQNYAHSYNGPAGIGNICQVNYNLNQETIKNGGPLSNIHDCKTQLGNYETYGITNQNVQLRCHGIFSAICQ